MRRPLLLLLVVPVLALAGAAAWGRAQIEYPAAAIGTATGEARPNVLFLTIDTLRADHVGVYGGRVRTPHLDRLAAEGVVARTAVAAVPYTTPSHVSMFTSTYPFEHGAKNGVPMRADLPTLPAILRSHGYHTAAFISAYTTRSNVTGLGHAFDVYEDSLNPDLAFLAREEFEALVVYRLLDRLAGNELRAPVVVERVRSWIERGVERPYFAWVHFFDPHQPYNAPAEFRAQYPEPDGDPVAVLLAGYAAEVAFTDSQVGLLLEALASEGLLENTIVVVTSDHGEAFREPHPHVDSGHGKHLYESVLHVPLLFWSPGRFPAGLELDQLVESVDLAPTLLELLGIETPESFAGQSLAPALRGGAAPGDGRAFSQTASLVRPRWFAVRTPAWKLLVNPDDEEEELFHLTTDPGEVENRVGQEPEVAARLRSLLSSTMRLDEEGVGLEALDEETRERLRALGYLD